MKQSPHIIFATAHEKFAVKAFELNATDYILKPFEKERINQAVNKVDMAKDKSKTKIKLSHLNILIIVMMSALKHMYSQLKWMNVFTS